MPVSLWLTDLALLSWTHVPSSVGLAARLLAPDWVGSVRAVHVGMGAEDTAVTQGQCPRGDGRREGSSRTNKHKSSLCQRPCANITLGKESDG